MVNKKYLYKYINITDSIIQKMVTFLSDEVIGMMEDISKLSRMSGMRDQSRCKNTITEENTVV